ncbi:hypothetical protein OG21DRAFT_1376576, partial [Imleria badia]
SSIGADFIAKTLPHPTRQIKSSLFRFGSMSFRLLSPALSMAFFRSAAALPMFDVNQPETLTALKKWWEEFRERAPLYDEDLEDYCCVIAGNKTDLV